MITVQIIEDERDFYALESEWQQLIQETTNATYFLTWEFTVNRWKHFQEGRQLWVLATRNQQGKLVGVAPFAIGSGHTGPLLVRRLEFICRVEIPFRFERYYLDGEDLDIIAHPEYSDAVAAMFALMIDQHATRWDVVDLGWLSASSPLDIHTRQVRRFVVERTAERARAALPADWETYESSVLPRGLSKQNRYKQRRLERDFPGAVRYQLVTDRDDVATAVENLEDLKVLQFKAKGSSTNANDLLERQHRSFARDFALSAFDRGWLRFYQLTVDNEVIAANFGIELHGVYYLLNKGLNPEWKKYSPGYVLQAHEVRCAIETGVREYDLGQGLIADKLLWTQTKQDDVRLIYGTTPKGHTYLAEEALWTTARTRGPELIRNVLPQSTYERIRRAFRERARALSPA